MRFFNTFLLVLCVAVGTSCCSNNISKTENAVTENSSFGVVEPKKDLKFTVTESDGITGFSMRLFSEVCKNSELENICISPASAVWALSMVVNGAAADTRDRMLRVLGVSNVGLDSLNAMQRSLIETLSVYNEFIRLSIANSIWINENRDVKEPFIAANAEYYNAEVKSVPFDNTVLNEVNRWCKEKTDGKIESILNELDPNTKMLLLNALYLKSLWNKPFAKELTDTAVFTKNNGENLRVNMMKQKFRTQYFENDTLQMASKPLGRGALSMFFIMPKSGVSLEQLYSDLSINYTSYVNRMENCEVIMGLPRFKTEFGASLKTMLQQMGMADAFSSSADFENISDAPLFISDVVQKSFIAVNEDGVEAAAVTAAVMDLLAMRPVAQPKEFIMNRPFIYLIVENNSSNGNILFMGKVGVPKE